jgi:hypothetical protein
MSYVLVVTWKPHQVISTVDTSSKQAWMFEVAIDLFLDAVAAGWLGYYQIHLDDDLSFEEISDDPEVKVAKATIEKRLNDQRPRIYRTLRDAGLVKSL